MQRAVLLACAAIVWLWASWWMGDVWRVAREHSYFAVDTTLMHFLWQQPFGIVWIAGRAMLTLFRWPLLGGAAVAMLLTLCSELTAYCLRLRPRWHAAAWLVAAAWMLWVSLMGLHLYFYAEPGRPLGVLLLATLVAAVDACVIWSFRSSRRKAACRMEPRRQAVHSLAAGAKGKAAATNNIWCRARAIAPQLCTVLIVATGAVAAGLVTYNRYPYLRPLATMQCQLMQADYDGMARTARANATLSYRPLAAYYAIALRHTGHLTDALFDIRLDFDSLLVRNRSGEGDTGSKLYEMDADYHAGLFLPATRVAMEELTMDGPSLHALKMLARTALLRGEWHLADKYLTVISRHPFEDSFTRRYRPMVGRADLVAADPEFARLRLTEPVADSFESSYEEPVFLGYTATLTAARSREALELSLMANLYSKRMPDFLARCQPLAGTTPPLTIAQGLATQSLKQPAVVQAFPSVGMHVQTYRQWLRAVAPYMSDRAGHARELFTSNAGYYPYYYFFGNLKATRRRTSGDTDASVSAGVN